MWVSNATNTFSVFKDPRGNTLGRGTRITLKLKEDSKDFLLETKIKKILQKYSEFVNYPIYLRVKKDVSREVPMTEEELAELEQYDTTTTKIVKEKVWEWEIVNENKPIWLRDDVEHSDYVEFYKTITKDNNEPLSYIHFTAEGEIEFKALLYIPSEAPYDSLQNHYDNKGLMKLYVRRVLITEEFEDLVPRYLNFVRGVVDSDDLPLNVARQDLQ